jgi:hypothetical protein
MRFHGFWSNKVRRREKRMLPVASLFIYFDDYRNVDGVKFPFYVYCDNPGITVRFQKVAHNQPIRDAEFIP